MRYDGHHTMNSIQEVHDKFPCGHSQGLRPTTILLLAAVAGMSVATLYYSQPMLPLMRSSLGVSSSQIGLVPMLIQLGYALGLLCLAPLGDRYDRRKIIMGKAALLIIALGAAVLARSMLLMCAASFVIGLNATLAQDAVSSAASLAPETQRGKIVGSVMSGLLLGILLSRVASGAIAEHFGWQTSYVLAGISILGVILIAWRALPSVPASTHQSYGTLMRSLAGLWGKYSELRRAAFAQALLAVGFSAFWSTLALMLADSYHLGSSVAGAFGIAGAAGALIAPVAGRVADRRGPEIVTKLGIGLSLVSFASMLAIPQLPTVLQLWALGLAVVLFDLGVQATMIAHQTIIYSLDPLARSRLNAILFTLMFTGMATGAGLGSLLYGQFGWFGVVILSTAASTGAFVLKSSKAQRRLEIPSENACLADS